jgi:hypothetical protein
VEVTNLKLDSNLSFYKSPLRKEGVDEIIKNQFGFLILFLCYISNLSCEEYYW